MSHDPQEKEIEEVEEVEEDDSSSSSSEESSSEEEKKPSSVKRERVQSESDASSVGEEKQEKQEKQEEVAIPSFCSLVSRVAFPFGYWYIYPSRDRQAPPSEELLASLKKSTLNTIRILFKMSSDPDLYILRGSREKDRLRVICPSLYVNSMSALHIRSLVLGELGYKESSVLIPSSMYRYPTVHPTVLLERQFDIARGKLEPRQTYHCFCHPHIKTEELEEKLNRWASYNETKPPLLTPYSEKYTQFLAGQKDTTPEDSQYENPPEMEEDTVFEKLLQTEKDILSKIPQRITEETKQKLGPRLDQCIDFFHRFHPDSKLRGISLYKEKIFLFDFTKSDRTCKICNVKHSGNRQYLVYSADSQKVFYHCHDQQAKNKSLSWPLKERRRGAEVVSIHD